MAPEYSFHEVLQIIQEKFDREKRGQVNMLYRYFTMTFIFLTFIWGRIIEEAELDIEYWKIYVDCFQPGYEREPTTVENNILMKWQKERYKLNLDIESWFLYSYILMDIYAKLMRSILLLIGNEEEVKQRKNIPFKDFNSHLKYYLKENNDNITQSEIKYRDIIKNETEWYINDLKNIRDDLVQHPVSPKMWSYDVTEKGVNLSRFNPFRENIINKLYELRDKNKEKYPEIKDEDNLYKLLIFFEKKIKQLDDTDVQLVDNQRKSLGGDFPEIPPLFEKITHFFYLTQEYLLEHV